jgi:hypothetical protein
MPNRIRDLSKESAGKRVERAAEVVLSRQVFIQQFSDLEDLGSRKGVGSLS